MERKSFYKLLLLWLFTIAIQSDVFSQFEEGRLTVRSFQPALSGNSLVENATRTVTYIPSGEDSVHIKNIILFKINESENVYFKSGFTATVTISVESKIDMNNPPAIENKSLAVNYDPAEGVKYNVLSYLEIPDAKEVKVTINSLQIDGGAGWDPRLVLTLDNEMRLLSYYTMSENPTVLEPSFFPFINLSDELDVSWMWNSDANNNMSQLEWAWVEDEMVDYYSVNGSTDFSRLFSSNSSRVDLDLHQNNYRIPLLYDGVGKLYYRVRAAYRKNNGNVHTGPWSDPQTFNFDGHNADLNWQSSTQFAENGKRKSVIQYLDGTMRSRQTVTKDNSTNTTIVGETIYDLQGRPNIQILPTPATGSEIKYFKEFNRFQGQELNDNPARYFDLTLEVLKCDKPPALDITKGNGRYYSINNDWLGTEEKSKYIPDAEGYAYAETRYTDDATQRVRSQGEVGINHQIGSGHETNYYFGKPAQQEMDALFGTDVGYAAHYAKNMVQDPNGQMSVSYVDMHGRTIATALAGDAPSNLESLTTDKKSYPLISSAILDNLLTIDNNLVNGTSIESISTILVPALTQYQFSYLLTPGILHLPGCSGQPICFDCKYDLEISIRFEDCEDNAPIIRRYNNLQMVSGDSCSISMGFIGDGITIPTNQINFNADLSPGSWVVRKTLTINDSLFKIRRDIALNELLCNSEQSIYDSIYTLLLSKSDCGIPEGSTAVCDSCIANLGDFAGYRKNYLEAIGQGNSITIYDSLIQRQFTLDSLECANSCGTLNVENTTLKNLRRQMLNDMIPFSGQYALEEVLNENGIIDLNRKEAAYNIFVTNAGNTKSPFFRKPVDESCAPSHYFTDEQIIDQNIEPENNPHTILDTISKRIYTNLFQRSWTGSLIYHHPEFSKLDFAEKNLTSSYTWLDQVLSCESYTEAQTMGYLNPLTSDPFFVNNYVSADKINMQRYLTSNIGPASDTGTLSIWRIANSQILCRLQPDENKPNCIYGQNKSGMVTAASPAQKEEIWQQFKSLYLSYRNEMVLNYINAQSNALTQQAMDELISEGKQLIFAAAGDIAGQSGMSDIWEIVSGADFDTTNLALTVENYINSTIPDKCESQRILWKAGLMECGQLMTLLTNENPNDSVLVNTILETILDSMVMVCRASTDSEHLYGASTANPNFTGTPRSFEEVIKNVFAQYQISTSPGNNYFCNPYTIDFPKPYGKNPPVMVNYSNQLDTCACSNFAGLKLEAAALNYDTLNLTGMNQFLSEHYQDSLSTTVWQGLQQCYTNVFAKDTCVLNMESQRFGIFANEDDEDEEDCGECDVCEIPIIYSAYHTDSTFTSAQLSYSTGLGYNSCSVNILDVQGNFVENISIPCGNNISIEIPLPSCGLYGLKVSAQSVICNESSAVFMMPAPNCNPCLPAPVILSASYTNTGSVNNVQVNYSISPQAEFITLFARDTVSGSNYSTSLTPGTSSAIISLPSCGIYELTIVVTINKVCVEMSADYILPACNLDCKEIYSPILLEDFVRLPAFLSCGYQKPCISCNDLDLLITEFRQLFPDFNQVPYLDSLTDDRVQQNALLTRFLNYRTGFLATITDYRAAYLNCGTNPGNNSALCNFKKPLNDPSEFFPAYTNPCRNVEVRAIAIAQQLFQQQKNALIANFDSLYKAKCLEAKYGEQFYVQYRPKEYHYTLYYYDQAGNLVKTMPPAGIKPNFNQTYLDSVAAERNAGRNYANWKNNEQLATQYRYNSLNQVAVQQSPDAGISKFWYDRLGRLAVSQNARQLLSNRYSYTLYDALGRITEVGQLVQSQLISQAISRNEQALTNWLASASLKEEITATVYDIAYSPLETILDGHSALFQKNLRNRVSYTFVKSLAANDWDAATFYTYDIHGNVDTLLQDFRTGMGAITCFNSSEPGGNRFKKMVYQYDLVSGKVNSVAYQPGRADQFYHRYEYDAENRLTEVRTSKDFLFWERDAAYDYYRHGPLARTVLGQNQVQGLDYAYTIHGWLKGVNSSNLEPPSNKPDLGDMGKDGHPSNGTPNPVAKDVFGFGLSYYQNDSQGMVDYLPIGSSSSLKPFANPGSAGGGYNSLFNGNISAMSLNLPSVGLPLLYTYRYDQLNRLKKLYTYSGLNPVTNSWKISAMQDYRETITYDPNGNILTYKRNGDAARSNASNTGMDNLTYHYKANTNQLDKVTDAAADASAGEYDKYNDIKQGQINNNYQYDAIGNLIKDVSEGITDIKWNVYGKINSITKAGSNISYTYDASGNRISKIAGGKTTFYVRDASGNVMSIYEQGEILKQKEVHLYGSSRVGIYNVEIDVQSCPSVSPEIVTFARGNKFFELSNHLGNILATVSDKKIGFSINGTSLDYYKAEVVNGQDYYPFGMGMPGRKYSIANTDYRYGFNGKELDKEVSGTTTYDYGFRIYSPGLGKFLSVDPLTKSYPWYTPYQFAGNKPIAAIDLDGLEELWVTNNAFAPFELFGSDLFGSYGGDGATRKFGDRGGTYRTSGTAHINLNTADKPTFETGTTTSIYYRNDGSK